MLVVACEVAQAKLCVGCVPELEPVEPLDEPVPLEDPPPPLEALLPLEDPLEEPEDEPLEDLLVLQAATVTTASVTR